MTLELLARENPFLLIAICDFNAKSWNWYNKDKTSFEGNTIENVTSQLGLHQIQPMHILPNSSSCIDLIFTSQPNMVIESGIRSSLYSSCHHQIVFAKFSLKIFYPPYSREVWHFKEMKTDLIRRALNGFNWERAFQTQMLTRKYVSSANLFSMFWVTLLHTKPYCAMIRIPRGLTHGLSLFYRTKIKSSKIIERTNPIFNYLTNETFF